MDDFTYEKAASQLEICRSVKRQNIEPWCSLADAYYNNQTTDADGTSPTDYVLQEEDNHLPMSNLIPFGTRIWQSVVMSAPFGVEVDPAGSRDPQGIKRKAANGLTNTVKSLRKRPDNKRMMRQMSLEALMYNITFLYDGWDEYAKPTARPFYKIVNWRDGYLDSSPIEPVNSYGGPTWVGVRCWYPRDYMILRYGKTRVDSLNKGILKEHAAYPTERRVFEEKYHVIHWWGFDMTNVRISRITFVRQLESQWRGILDGSIGQPDKIDPHRIAIDEGDKRFIQEINTLTGGSIPLEAEQMSLAAQRAIDAGLGTIVQNYAMWRQWHMRYLINGVEGGKREKYPGSVYRAEFQEGNTDLLLAPQPSPFTHNQLPVSVARRHEGSNSYWTPGIMQEALQIQRYVEFLEKRRDSHLHFESMPAFGYLRDMLPESYRDPEQGEENLLEDLMEGFPMIPIDGTTTPPQNVMGFIQPGPISPDVKITLADKMRYMMELFGASEVMRGQGPGAEASGKHIQLMQAAASRPSTFMVSLLEGPLHNHYERMISNVMQYASPEWLAQVVKEDEMQAIMAVRDSSDFHAYVQTRFGSGMPTDWISQFQIYMQLVAMGIYPPESLTEELNIPAPPQGTLEARGPQPGNQTTGQVTGGAIPNVQNLGVT